MRKPKFAVGDMVICRGRLFMIVEWWGYLDKRKKPTYGLMPLKADYSWSRIKESELEHAN